jgi:hypothetical protein
MGFNSTTQVALALGVRIHNLFDLFRSFKLQRPAHRTPSGDLAWFPEDIEAARAALANKKQYRPRKVKK